jgi:hypothetical protein
MGTASHERHLQEDLIRDIGALITNQELTTISYQKLLTDFNSQSNVVRTNGGASRKGYLLISHLAFCVFVACRCQAVRRSYSRDGNPWSNQCIRRWTKTNYPESHVTWCWWCLNGGPVVKVVEVVILYIVYSFQHLVFLISSNWIKKNWSFIILSVTLYLFWYGITNTNHQWSFCYPFRGFVYQFWRPQNGIQWLKRADADGLMINTLMMRRGLPFWILWVIAS